MKKALLLVLALFSISFGQLTPEWEIFNTSNSILTSNKIKDIEVDRFNRKWILTENNLVMVEGNVWKNYDQFISGYNFSQGKIMSVDYSGNVWIGGYIGNTIGILKFDGTTAVSYNESNSPLPCNVIHSISIDRNNKLYILNGLPGPPYPLYLTTFDGTNWKNYTGMFFYDDAGEITAFDDQGYLYVPSATSLSKFKDSTYTTIASGPFGNYLTDIKFDSFGNLWFAQGWGGWRTVRKYSNGSSINYPYHAVSLTNDGDAFWIGGFNDDNGLSSIVVRCKDNIFTEFNSQNSPLPNSMLVQSIKSDHRGNKWIGLYDGGVAVYREGGVAYTPVELNSFNAAISGDVVNLNWQTATELNNRGFEIERSFDGSAYSTIGFIAGNGTTTKPCSYSYTDDLSDKNISGTVLYRLKQLDNDGTFEYSDVVSVVKDEIPSAFVLEQNYPNPFNPSTVIKYQLPTEGNVTLKVYNNLGEEVALLVNEFKQAGIYTADFSAANLPSGIYYYRLTGDNGFSATKKMMVVK